MLETRSDGFTAASVPDAYDRFMSPQLFEPWARQLIERAQLAPGAAVLDVASGPGPVARLAASVVGATGRVVASDIAPAMLAVAKAKPTDPSSAPIGYLQCSADAIEAPDECFDIVLCQQGLQFFPDRKRAVSEMRRVVRAGGAVVASTWAAERPLGLFGPMVEVLAEAGLPEPFPRAFDATSYALSAGDIESLLTGAGLRNVAVETVELDATWRSIDEVLGALGGTPFGPVVAALDEAKQRAIHESLARRLGGAPGAAVTIRTASHLGHATR